MSKAEASDLKSNHDRVLQTAKDLHVADLAYREAVRQFESFLLSLVEKPK